MFKRLHTNGDIIEVLLTKKQIVAALHFIRSQEMKGTKISAARFLEATLSDPNPNPALFFTVYKFFEKRNELIGTECDIYIQRYKELFGANAIDPSHLRQSFSQRIQ